MPEMQSYYLSIDEESECNVHRTDCALTVNCAGLCVLSQTFITYQEKGREDFYLQYMTKGEMDVWINGEKIIMGPGQAIMYYPHTLYHYSMRGSRQVQYYWMHFTGADSAGLVDDCRIPNQKLLNLGVCEDIFAEFENLFREFIVRDGMFRYLSAAKVITILSGISRYTRSDAYIADSANRRMLASLSFIHKNYHRDITVDSLAGMEHLSVSRYRVVFKERTGLSPTDYIINLRINHAKSLLTQTDLSVGEIAASVGYTDQMYFSRIFKDRTGLRPTVYQKSGR